MQDIATMTDLVENAGTGISFAVLLIVRLRLRFWMNYSSTAFARGYAPRHLEVALGTQFLAAET
jgi:hypothetical protein